MSVDVTEFLNELKHSLEISKEFEVAAMPARQMKIDADLKAGRITEDEAKERREYILRIANDVQSCMIKERIMANIIFPTLKEIAEVNGFNLYERFIVSTDILGKFREWSFNVYLKNKKWAYLGITLKFVNDGKKFLYGLLSGETEELEKSKLNKHLPKIKEYIKEEAKKYGYESENTHFLIYKEALWKMWELLGNLENTKAEEFSIEIENMKREFENIIRELFEIGELLEGKLKEG